MAFGLTRSVSFVLRAILWSPISPVRPEAAIFALAPFKVFPVRQAAIIPEFFKRVSDCPESVRCRAQRVNDPSDPPAS